MQVRYLFKWVAAYEKTLEIKQFSEKVAMNSKRDIINYMKVLVKYTAEKSALALKHHNSKNWIYSCLQKYAIIFTYLLHPESISHCVVLKWHELTEWRNALRRHRVRFVSLHVVCAKYFSIWRDMKFKATVNKFRLCRLHRLI